MKFYLPRSAVRIVGACSAEAGRFPLHAVRVEMEKPSEVTLVATDGRILARARFDQPESVKAEPGEPFLIRGAHLKALLALPTKPTPRSDWYAPGVVFDHAGETLKAATSLGSIDSAKESWFVGGTFPEYGDVMPAPKAREKPSGRFGLGGRLMVRVSSIVQAVTDRDSDTLEVFPASTKREALLVRAKGFNGRIEVAWMPVELVEEVTP